MAGTDCIVICSDSEDDSDIEIISITQLSKSAGLYEEDYEEDLQASAVPGTGKPTAGPDLSTTDVQFCSGCGQKMEDTWQPVPEGGDVKACTVCLRPLGPSWDKAARNETKRARLRSFTYKISELKEAAEPKPCSSQLSTALMPSDIYSTNSDSDEESRDHDQYSGTSGAEKESCQHEKSQNDVSADQQSDHIPSYNNLSAFELGQAIKQELSSPPRKKLKLANSKPSDFAYIEESEIINVDELPELDNFDQTLDVKPDIVTETVKPGISSSSDVAKDSSSLLSLPQSSGKSSSTNSYSKGKSSTARRLHHQRLTFCKFRAMKKVERAKVLQKHIDKNRDEEAVHETHEPPKLYSSKGPILFSTFVFPWRIPCPVRSSGAAELPDTYCNIVEVQRDNVAMMTTALKEYISFDLKPPSHLLSTLVDTIRKCYNCDKVKRAVQDMKDIHSLHKDIDISFQYADLEELINDLILPYSDLCDHKKVCKLYIVDYMIHAVMCEFSNASLASQRQIWKTSAACWLRADRNFSRTRQIIHWIYSAVSLGQFDEQLGGGAEDLFHNMHKRRCDDPSWPKLLPMLQSLLDVSVHTTTSPQEYAERVASEMALVYCRVANFSERKCMLNTMVSPLLVFHTCQRILEDHCPGVDVSSGRYCLRDLVESHFQRELLQNAATPPPSPREDAEGEGHNAQQSSLELAQLIVKCLEAYLQYAKGKLHQAVPKRVLSPPETLSLDDMHALSTIKDNVAQLRERLRGSCSHAAIDYYMSRITCLSDLIGL